MTNKEAKEIMSKVTFYWELGEQTLTQNQINEAFDMAIKALEQQPTDTKTYLKRREENYVEYNVEWFLKNWELELEILSGGKIKPTDADCISRKAVLDMATTIQTDDFSGNEIIEVVDVDDIKELPPITPQQKIGHWERRLVDYKKCSECGHIVNFYRKYNYCPNCGARMVESEDK